MKRYLVLENGEVFAGLALGAPCDTFGELVFTTGMNGYIETLTDPSYCGQIVLQTFPLIGNYGIIPADFEGKCCVRGYVVREACSTPSNFRCAQTLDAFLKENNIPGITGIDTRATILGHVQRGGSPTLRDRVNASAMGYQAVCLLEQGKYNRIVGMKGEKLVDYPVDEALEMTKTLDPVLIDVCNTISI